MSKAAKQGFLDAQYHLGLMYFVNEGGPEDFVQSYAWLNLAAARGHEKAKEAKETIAEFLTRDQIAEAQKLSGDYWEPYGQNKKYRIWEAFVSE